MKVFDKVYRLTAWRQTPPSVNSSLPVDWFEVTNYTTIITQMDIKFRVTKTLKAEPNSAEIYVYNLNKASREDLSRVPLRVQLEAGYDDEYRLVFVGDLKPGSGSKLDGTTWETKLLLGDGLRAYANARISRSYRKGTPMKTILRDVAQSMSLRLPQNLEDDPRMAITITSGEVAHGWSSDELTRLLAPYGYQWSMQNNTLQVIPDEATNGNVIRLIDSSNGLTESPVVNTPTKGKSLTVSAKTTLYPEVQPGDLIKISSLTVNGEFKATQVIHEGESAGQAWDTIIEASV